MDIRYLFITSEVNTDNQSPTSGLDATRKKTTRRRRPRDPASEAQRLERWRATMARKREDRERIRGRLWRAETERNAVPLPARNFTFGNPRDAANDYELA